MKKNIILFYNYFRHDTGAVSAMFGMDPMALAVHSECINRPATIIIDKDGIMRLAYYGTF